MSAPGATVWGQDEDGAMARRKRLQDHESEARPPVWVIERSRLEPFRDYHRGVGAKKFKRYQVLDVSECARGVLCGLGSLRRLIAACGCGSQ